MKKVTAKSAMKKFVGISAMDLIDGNGNELRVLLL